MSRCTSRALTAVDGGTGHAAIPGRINARLVGLTVVVNGWLWIGLPLVVAADPAWGWTLVPLGLLTTTHWSLVHEAFHGSLFRGRRANQAGGRALALLLCCSFRTLKFGHLMHHRFNRSGLDRTEVLSAAEYRRVGAWAYYYGRLTFGLYWVEVLGGWSTLLPKRALAWVVRTLFGGVDADGRTRLTAAKAQLLSPAALMEMRADALMTIALTAGGFWMYGPAWWMLAAALFARGFMISFFDNPYHYGTPLNATLYAMNLRLPKPLAVAILYFNLHAAHHMRPSLPWTALPAFAGTTEHRPQEGYLRAALRQLKGPLREDRLPVTGGVWGEPGANRNREILTEA